MIPVWVVARASKYSWKEARGLLSRAGILQKEGAFLYVDRERLRARLRSVYQDVFGYYTQPRAAEDAPR
jgi:hypothetical protein